MCTKKTLYRPGTQRQVSLRTRERGGKLNFLQISYTTDCVREVANRLDMPMVQAIGELRAKKAFARIYREARKSERRPAAEVAAEVIAM